VISPTRTAILKKSSPWKPHATTATWPKEGEVINAYGKTLNINPEEKRAIIIGEMD